jgi:hypothetical protein
VTPNCKIAQYAKCFRLQGFQYRTSSRSRPRTAVKTLSIKIWGKTWNVCFALFQNHLLTIPDCKIAQEANCFILQDFQYKASSRIVQRIEENSVGTKSLGLYSFDQRLPASVYLAELGYKCNCWLEYWLGLIFRDMDGTHLPCEGRGLPKKILWIIDAFPAPPWQTLTTSKTQSKDTHNWKTPTKNSIDLLRVAQLLYQPVCCKMSKKSFQQTGGKLFQKNSIKSGKYKASKAINLYPGQISKQPQLCVVH